MIEVEKDQDGTTLLFSFLASALLAVGAYFLSGNVWVSLWVYLMMAGVSTWLRILWQRRPTGLPEQEINEAAGRAVTAFSSLYPNERILGWALRLMTPAQYVISVRYEKDGLRAKPPLRRYFVVSRAGVYEADARLYGPRGQK